MGMLWELLPWNGIVTVQPRDKLLRFFVQLAESCRSLEGTIIFMIGKEKNYV